MSLAQPFVPVGMPLVDSNGMLTPIAVQFFLNLWQRTNGAAGPSAPLTGEIAASNTAAINAATSSASAASLSASTAQASAADAQILAALNDLETARSDDHAALLAQLIAD